MHRILRWAIKMKKLVIKKVAWITGASSGIGEALCYKLSNEGWEIILTARRLEKLKNVSLKLKTNFMLVPADVTDEYQMKDAIKSIYRKFKSVDLCILNAGIYKSVDGKKIISKTYKEQMNTNYIGVINALEGIVPRMVDKGNGQIMVVASPTGWIGLPLASAYGPTKAALINLTQSLRYHLEPCGIKMQLVTPGFIYTESTPTNEHDLPGIISAEKAAILIFKAISSNRFQTMIPSNFLMWTLYLIKFLPEKLVFKLIKWKTGF